MAGPDVGLFVWAGGSARADFPSTFCGSGRRTRAARAARTARAARAARGARAARATRAARGARAARAVSMARVAEIVQFLIKLSIEAGTIRLRPARGSNSFNFLLSA